LYHGTSPSRIWKIIKEGIRPRTLTGKSNWNQVAEFKSRNDMVYLTSCYPLYFAACCSRGSRLAVVEVDVDKLDKSKLYPDEDVVAQIMSQETNVSLKEVHPKIKAKLLYMHEEWETSLQAMGTCCFCGVIPPEALSRYAMIETKNRKQLLLSMMDPAISILNYKFKGEYYKGFVAWVFGDRNTLPQTEETQMFIDAGIPGLETRFAFWKQEQDNREGIQVIELTKGKKK